VRKPLGFFVFFYMYILCTRQMPSCDESIDAYLDTVTCLHAWLLYHFLGHVRLFTSDTLNLIRFSLFFEMTLEVPPKKTVHDAVEFCARGPCETRV
jgi:hypothetical protein